MPTLSFIINRVMRSRVRFFVRAAVLLLFPVLLLTIYPQAVFQPDKTTTELSHKNGVPYSNQNVTSYSVSFQKSIRSEHMFVISATYFSKNKSYPANTMAMVFDGPRKPFENQIKCWSKNETHSTAMLANIFEVRGSPFRCKWEGYIATCPVVYKPTEFGLLPVVSLGTEAPVARLPYREADPGAYGVVACISPMFCTERWQLVVHMLEIYRQFGVQLQVYYMDSVLTEIVNYIKVYERLNLARIATWPKIVVDAKSKAEMGYDPNGELEVRNQPTSYNDCLLRYKDAAEFIMFGDTDDVLYPREGRTYLDEFRYLSSMFPNAGAFLYTRFNANFLSSRLASEYSVSGLVKSIKISRRWMSEKYVGIPSRVNASYIHWPAKMVAPYETQDVPTAINMMVHLRRWRTVDRSTGNLPNYILRFFKKSNDSTPPFEQVTQLIPDERTDLLEQNFRHFVEEHASQEFRELPNLVRYYPVLEKCYDTMMYTRNSMPRECVGHTKCNIRPITGVNCSTVRATYTHVRLSPTLAVHYANVPHEVTIRNNGCEF